MVYNRNAVSRERRLRRESEQVVNKTIKIKQYATGQEIAKPKMRDGISGIMLKMYAKRFWDVFCVYFSPMPSVMWAQRHDKLYVTIMVDDCKDASIKFDENCVHFRFVFNYSGFSITLTNLRNRIWNRSVYTVQQTVRVQWRQKNTLLLVMQFSLLFLIQYFV